MQKKKKKVQKTGMVTDRRISRGPTTPKALTIPKPMTFPRFSQQIKLEKEWNEKMEHLNGKYNLDYYS